LGPLQVGSARVLRCEHVVQAIEAVHYLLCIHHGLCSPSQTIHFGQTLLDFLQPPDRRLHIFLDDAAYRQAQIGLSQRQRPALNLLAQPRLLPFQHRACIVSLGGQGIQLALDLFEQRAEPFRLLQILHVPSCHVFSSSWHRE
jgi:hypothetical protein